MFGSNEEVIAANEAYFEAMDKDLYTLVQSAMWSKTAHSQPAAQSKFCTLNFLTTPISQSDRIAWS